MAKKNKKRVTKTTKFFNDSPTKDETSSDSENDSQKPQKPCGTKNADGTFYGGGPLDVTCSKCKKANFPTVYCHGHRSNQKSYCPQLQLIDSSPMEDSRSKLNPNLKHIADECLPVTPNAKAKVSAKEVLMTRMTPDDILTQVADGELNVQAAKLMLLSLMKDVGDSQRPVLQSYIDNCEGLAPKEAKQPLFHHPNLLNGKGKLLKLYTQCVSHVMETLHKTGKSEHQQKPTFDLTTGKLTVETKADAPIQSMAIFNMVLELFRHIVVTRDHLGESELHALLTWTNHQLALSKKLVIVERCVEAILQHMDDDHGRDLTKLICKDARNILDDQTDIYASSFQRTAPTATEAEKKATAKAKAAATKPANAQDDDVTISLKQPNAVSCWYDTNGLRCANKIKDASGECKYKHLHGTCGMPLSGGGYCMEQHKAAEHK